MAFQARHRDIWLSIVARGILFGEGKFLSSNLGYLEQQ
jgi:hypothetical protein